MLHVTQTVQDDGAVLMDNEEVNRYPINPYSNSGTTCSILTVPYPMITTPEPHFYVNDYQEVRDIAMALSLSPEEVEKLQSIDEKNLLQFVERDEDDNGDKDDNHNDDNDNDSFQFGQMLASSLQSGHNDYSYAQVTTSLKNIDWSKLHFHHRMIGRLQIAIQCSQLNTATYSFTYFSV